MKSLYPLRIRLLLLLVMIPLALYACRNNPFSNRKASQRLTQGDHQLFTGSEAHDILAAAFPAKDTGKGIKSVSTAMSYVYAATDYAPIWVAEEGLTDEAQKILSDLDSLHGDGIDPEWYRLSQLKASFERLQREGTTAEAIAFDTACTHAYLQASHDLLFGVLVPRKADTLWFHAN